MKIILEQHLQSLQKCSALHNVCDKPPRLAVSIIDIIVTCLPSEMVSSGRGYSGLKRALDKLSASKWQAHVSHLDLLTRAWKYHHSPSSPDQATAAVRAEEELFSERMLGIFVCCTAAAVTKIVDFPPAALTGVGFEVGWGGDFPAISIGGMGRRLSTSHIHCGGV